MPSIPYVSASIEEPADIVSKIRIRRGGSLLHLDRMLLHSPKFAHGWDALLGAVRSELSLLPRLRELAVCAVAVLNRADYELQQHTRPYCEAGGTLEELDVLKGGPESWICSHRFGPAEQAALALTVAMTRAVDVPPALLTRVRSHLPSDQQLVELVGVVGTYNMVSRFLVALHIEVEVQG